MVNMRVAMVTPFPASPDEIGGGVEVAAASLVAALGRVADLDLHVFTPHWTAEPDRTEIFAGATIHRLRHPPGPAFVTTPTVFTMQVQRALKRLKPDVVHVQANACWLPVAGGGVLTVHGISEHDILFSPRALRRLRSAVVGMAERLGRRRAEHVIAINPYVLELLGAQLRGRPWHIPNPVSARVFAANGPSRAPALLYAGHISELKNVLSIIEVFGAVRGRVPAATLTLAGAAESESYLATCRAVVAKLGLNDAVRFLGRIDSDAMVRELAQARCLVLLSHQEMAPMVISEAQAAGVPPVAHAICGVPYMIEDGRTGFLVPRGDTAVATERIVQVLSDDAMLDDISAQARAHARQTCEADAVARRTLEVYTAAAM